MRGNKVQMQMTQEARARLETTARAHGFSVGAAQAMLDSLVAGHGRQAQFNHPEFGGMGQWSGNGMLMIGDMFNNDLKARVDALIDDLADLVPAVLEGHRSEGYRPGPSGRWPAELGPESASGSQNGMDYAVFPRTRRLAIRQGGQVSVYDTGDHVIGGVSQQQGAGHGLQFASQHGPVSLDSLKPVPLPDDPPLEAGHSDAAPSFKAASDNTLPDDASGSIPAMIERLHDLLSRGILNQAEFDAKKADLLGRM